MVQQQFVSRGRKPKKSIYVQIMYTLVKSKNFVFYFFIFWENCTKNKKAIQLSVCRIFSKLVDYDCVLIFLYFVLECIFTVRSCLFKKKGQFWLMYFYYFYSYHLCYQQSNSNSGFFNFFKSLLDTVFRIEILALLL